MEYYTKKINDRVDDRAIAFTSWEEVSNEIKDRQKHSHSPIFFGKSIKMFRNPNQLDMFIALGTEKEFAPGDKRKLGISKKGKKRWMDADEKNKVAKRIVEKPLLDRKEAEYLIKMMPTVEIDLASGRDFSSTIQSIKSAIDKKQFEAIKQFYIDQKIINNKEEYIGNKQGVIPIDIMRKMSDEEIELLKQNENWGTSNNAYHISEIREANKEQSENRLLEKQPYQMSLKEFIRIKRKELGEHYLVAFEVGGETGAGVVGEEHKRLVKQAIEEGKIKFHEDYPELSEGIFIHDYNSNHDVDIVANIFREKAKEFNNIKDFIEYIQRADGIWQIIFDKYKKDTGKDSRTASKDFDNYENYLAEKSSILLNKEVGSKKRNASFDFEKIFEKYGNKREEKTKNVWVRGVNSKNENEADKFYSRSKEIAANFAIDKVGDKPRFEELKEEQLPINPLIVSSKDALAAMVGFAEDPYTSRKFDNIGKRYAEANGHDAIIYLSGTFEEPELHLFGKREQKKSALAALMNIEVSKKPEDIAQRMTVYDMNKYIEVIDNNNNYNDHKEVYDAVKKRLNKINNHLPEPEEWIEQQLSKYEKRQKFSIEPRERNPLLPTEIKFIPTSYREEKNRVKAIAVGLDGEEELASSADIGAVVGRPFFQNETDRIPYVRLRLWLDNLISDVDAETEADKRMALRRTYYKQFGKAMKKKLFKAFGQQISLFNNTTPEPSREGETKQGKGGLLQLKKDKKSATKMRWQLAEKKQKEGKNPGEMPKPTLINAGRKTINTNQAYDLLKDKLGNKAMVTDKQGNKMGDGTFQLINENSDGTSTIFIKSGDGETKTISFPNNQAVQQNLDNVEFIFSDRNISISLNERENNLDELQENPQLVINKVEKMKEYGSRADQYILEAGRQKDKFLQDLDEVAEDVGIEQTSYKYGRHAIKSKDSIINKFQRNAAKGNDQKELSDILRGTLEIKKPEQFEGILESFKKRGYEVWKNDLVNLYDDPKPGYKHIAVKLVLGKQDKLVKEIICITPNMVKAKFGFGHDLYDLEKNIDIALGDDVRAGHKLHPALVQVKQTIKKLSNQFYKRAYYADLKGTSLDDFSNSTEDFIPPKFAQASNSSRKLSLGYDKPPKRLIRVLRSSLKAIMQPISASLRNSSGSMFNLDASSDMIDSSISSIITPMKNITKKYAGILRNLFKSSNRSRAMKFIKAFGIQMNLFGDVPTGTEKDGKRLEASKKNPAVRRWQTLEEPDKDIDSDIRAEELDKLLMKKYSEVSRDDFIKYLDGLTDKLELKEKHKNDFQAAKRRNILRDWNRKLSEGNINPKFKGQVFSIKTFGVANNPNFKIEKQPYELSRKEYTNKAMQQWRESAEYQKKYASQDKGGTSWRTLNKEKKVGQDAFQVHKRLVEQAINEGKITSHPDYPELSTKRTKEEWQKFSAEPVKPILQNKNIMNVKNVKEGLKYNISAADQEGMQRKDLIRELEGKIRKRGMQIAIYSDGMDVSDDPVIQNLKRQLNKVIQEDAINYARAIGD